MTIQLVKKLENIKDLFNVESCIRAMYQTADGATCQAMMTMEYRCWRHNVVRKILSSTQNNSPKVNNLQADVEAQQSIQAILSGFKIVFVKDTCYISQILPATYEQTWKKDNARLLAAENETTVDDNMRQECYHNVFKKHKICHSPRQA
jgi:hypothetical protein